MLVNGGISTPGNLATIVKLNTCIMKKSMISMAIAVFASVSFANANSTGVLYSPAAIVTMQEKVEIKPQELPEAVKTTLRNGTYQSWQIQQAFTVTADGGEQIYELTLSKGEESQTVKLDKDGKVIE